MRGLEAVVFTGLAGLVHAAVFLGAGLGDPAGGAQGAGDGGTDVATLAAVPEWTALAESWDRAPEVETEGTTLAALTEPPLAPIAPETDPVELPARPVLDQPDLPPEAPVLADAPVSIPAQPAALPGLPVLPAPSPAPVPERTAALAPPPLPPRAPSPDTRPATPRASDLAVTRAPRPPQRPERVERASAPATEPARPARQAAGSGAAEVGGNRGQAPAATLSAGQRNSLMAGWGAEIRARIDRARPRVAGRGVVTLALRVGRDGRLAGVSVAGSSGNPDLDRAAVRAVEGAGRFPAAPAQLTESAYGFTLPVRFR